MTISIHAPHAGSDPKNKTFNRFQLISIHAPHAGSDNEQLQATCNGQISIHAPHAGSDSGLGADLRLPAFQSTLPMRGATKIAVRFFQR